MTKEEVIMLIKEEIAVVINQEPNSIDEDEVLLRIGISSVQILKIINRLRKKLVVDISPVALFEYKTISAFANYLHQSMKEVV
ncbi:MAG: acyl carrier protein [Halanaerobiales bacterium]|nr:acyl carrier protein [Halanaerobiales bacterium]